MKSAPVTVIIPCYCCADVLMRAVDSVFSQTLLPTEIILIDDASVDGGATRACIENIVSNASMNSLINIRASYLTKNLGAGEARNIALDMSTQLFWAFLDSDDSWVPEKLQIQYHWMLKHSEYTFTCHEASRLSFSNVDYSPTSMEYFEIEKINLIFRNSIQTSSVMMRSDKSYRFPKAMRYAEDYWLWLHLKFSGARMVNINLKMSFSYKKVYGESGLSSNLYKMHKGVLRCFFDLWTAKLIGLSIYMAACLVEIFKFTCRIYITGWNKLRSNIGR